MWLVKTHTAALMCGVALGFVGVGAAVAQTSDVNAGNVTLLERLVIGAGKPKIAIDTPQAVTVVNQTDIDAVQATSISDVLETVPGVTIIGSERILGESFNIRGIGSAETSGDESRIIVNVDGAKKFYEQYRMGSFFSDPELYKQVEVLRGPASSTLYGSGALGGVINFTTKDASDFIQDGNSGAARIKTQYNTNGNGTLVSGVLAQQVTDNVDVLATGNWRRSNNFELANGDELTGSEFEALSGLIKGTARFGEDNDQVVRLSYQRWSSDAQDQDYSQTGTLAAFGLVDREVLDQTAVLSYENEDIDNPWIDLKASVSFSDTAVNQSGALPIAASFGNAEYGYRTWQANVENTSQFSGDNWENYLTYGFQLSTQDRIAKGATGNGVIGTHPEGTDTRLGLFAQSEFIYDEKLTIIPGVRGDFVWQKPEVSRPEQRDVEDFALSPKLAALYDFNDNFSVFGSVAHTERLPSLDELFQYGDTRRPSLDLNKESSNNYEAGFAISGFELFQDGDQAGVKVTGFYNDISDLIQANPRGVVGPYFSNISDATIYGVEIEGSYDAEYFFGRMAYTATSGENSNTGVALTSIPAHKLSVTLGARQPEYGLEYGVKGTFVASADTGVAPATFGSAATDGYVTLDAYTAWKPTTGAFKGTEVRLGVDNIFNQDFRDNQSSDRSTGRTFKLSLSKQFDW